ncbi:MAG: nodulation protein NfeD, partial [Candidatus Auribacterota bacterium]|nr:nodulation protein NfeD [Candidatus Auribacterota bacterium]
MKKLPLILFSFLLLFLIPVSVPAQSAGPVYVIPVEGEIEKGLIWVIDRGIEEAEAAGAQAIILHM